MPVLRRAVAALSLVGLIIVGSAPAAGAHAVLLRTTPAAQSTVADSPTSVQLVYSEPVEVAFGAIRVFDVEGRRVDTGSVTRAAGGREVAVGVPSLDDGTYTVTWRVVSADGHALRGGFVFYVGAPSSISAVAIDEGAGAGPALGWTYGAVRLVWFAALAAVAGLVAARRWVWTPVVRDAGLVESEAASVFRRRFRVALPMAWLTLAAATVGIVVFQAATASGLPLGSAARVSVVRELLKTTFGHVWFVEGLLVAVLALPVFALVSRRRVLGASPRVWIVALGALVVAMTAMAPASGHARTASDRAIALAATSVHLLSALVWTGALAAVVVVGGAAWRRLDEPVRRETIHGIVRRFGRVGLASVALLAVTGTVLAFVNLAAVSDLWRTTYGRLVAVKVGALVIALAIAARHRRVLPRFRGWAAVEVLVLAAALALASGLVAAVPGRSLALAAKGPVSQERPVATYTVQLFLDPSKVGDNQVHLTFVGAGGIAAAEVTNADAATGLAGEALEPIALRLIAPGHFVADVDFPTEGRYALQVTLPSGDTTTFNFKLTDR